MCYNVCNKRKLMSIGSITSFFTSRIPKPVQTCLKRVATIAILASAHPVVSNLMYEFSTGSASVGAMVGSVALGLTASAAVVALRGQGNGNSERVVAGIASALIGVGTGAVSLTCLAGLRATLESVAYMGTGIASFQAGAYVLIKGFDLEVGPTEINGPPAEPSVFDLLQQDQPPEMVDGPHVGA
jgi:hypothetical protein